MLFRIQPGMVMSSYKTYALKAPPATHWKAATCKDVDCEAYANGWITRIDASTELGRAQLNYIRLQSGRHYMDNTKPGSNIVELWFRAGQKCFAQHKVPLDREPVYLVRGGDWRGSTGLIRRHISGEDWVDDFANHQDKLATRLGQG